MPSKGEQTRVAILDEAIRMSSTVGLDALSLANLARHVGMSKSGLFAHFTSKEDLQVQLIQRAREQFIARVIAPALKEPRGEPRYRALFQRWMDWDSGPDLPGGCVFMTFAHELDDRPGPARDTLVRALRDWIETLATACRGAIEEGHFREDLDVEAFVFECYGVVLSYNHYTRMLDMPGADSRARTVFSAVIERAHPE